MKKNQTSNDKKAQLRELNTDELATVNGGMLSPYNCNALRANGFLVSWEKFCT